MGAEGRGSPPMQGFEWRLATQEHALQNLMNNVTTLKAEVVDGARANKEFWKKYRGDHEHIAGEFKSFGDLIHRMNNDFILNDFQQRSDRQSSEIAPALRNSHDLLVKQLSDLDNRLNRSIDQSRAELHTSTQASLNERHALENRIADRINSLVASLENRVVSYQIAISKRGQCVLNSTTVILGEACCFHYQC
ncbi:hypothetical protein Ciccas_011223 [Cichlidogyrus casuarinus]|uniref:Uncharacterized protein n=1 Tax=Cichlidogyrus casuarinus TaxID=1844966 RepID=A0ABD2PRW3_9PLAT